jgi:hypothetical protein
LPKTPFTKVVGLRVTFAAGLRAGERHGFILEFEEGRTPAYFELADMEQELFDALDGRAVDLRTPNELGLYFRDEVMADAKVQYAKG